MIIEVVYIIIIVEEIRGDNFPINKDLVLLFCNNFIRFN
jgi:hypothetical protein